MTDENQLNPFGLDPDAELLRTPQPDPLWAEFAAGFAYDPDENIGLWVHIGRNAADPGVCRASVGIYLPDGELLVARTSGRNTDRFGQTAGPAVLRCVEPLRLWEMSFDGYAQPVTAAEITSEALREAPTELVDVRFLMEASSPLLTYPQSLDTDGESWGTAHHEQVMTARGRITYRGKTVELRGVAARDHTDGPRDYAPVEGEFWFLARFESGRSVTAQAVKVQGREEPITFGWIDYGDGGPVEEARVVERPVINDAKTAAGSVAANYLDDRDLRRYRLVLETSRGREEFEGEILNVFAVTYYAPSHEIVGTDLVRPGGMQMADAPTRVTWNGDVGYGVRERVVRTHTLRSPEPAR